MKYKVSLSTKIKPSSVKKGSGILVIEPDDYKKEEVSELKKKGFKVLAYLSIGTIEKERSWYEDYKKYKLKQLPDWPKEYYVNVRKTAWRKFLANRAATLLALGYDGLWLDNLDVYEEYKSTAMFNACLAVLQKIKGMKAYVMINGGSEWLDDAIDKKLELKNYISGYTQEEVFSLIKSYSGKGKFGKQESKQSKFYQKLLKKVKKAGPDGFLLEYTRDSDLKKTIKDFCEKNKMSCCISGDVNL